MLEFLRKSLRKTISEPGSIPGVKSAPGAHDTLLQGYFPFFTLYRYNKTNIVGSKKLIRVVEIINAEMFS